MSGIALQIGAYHAVDGGLMAFRKAGHPFLASFGID